VEVSVGSEHTCARLDDATLTCGGYDLDGQLGRGRKGGGDPLVIPNFPNVTSFEVGPAHSCAKSAGVLHCWGANTYGQVGDGSTTDQYSPTKVLAP
jgi:alpha-tubulin suppressor-like RCC1 family protein